MGSDFIEDPIWGDVPLRFISLKLGPMMFRLNAQVFLKKKTYLPICQPSLPTYLPTNPPLSATSFLSFFYAWLPLPCFTLLYLIARTLFYFTVPCCTLPYPTAL